MNPIPPETVPHWNDYHPRNRGGSVWEPLALAILTGIIVWPFVDLYNDVLHLPVQWKILYASSTYIFAVAATLGLPRLAKRVTRKAITIAVLAVLLGALFAALFGSLVIVYLIVQALHEPHEGSDALFGLALWGAAFISLFLWAHPELRQKRQPDQVDAGHDPH